MGDLIEDKNDPEGSCAPDKVGPQSKSCKQLEFLTNAATKYLWEETERILATIFLEFLVDRCNEFNLMEDVGAVNELLQAFITDGLCYGIVASMSMFVL